MLKAPGQTTERISRAQLRTERIKTLGHRDPVTVASGTSLAAAIAAMQANDGEPILITDGSRLVGVLLLRSRLPTSAYLPMAARAVASPEVRGASGCLLWPVHLRRGVSVQVADGAGGIHGSPVNRRTRASMAGMSCLRVVDK